MWVRKRIDIGWFDLLSGVANCFRRGSRVVANEVVERAWSTDGRAFACLSVRTGLDLVLTALHLPAGSEVLMSAITIPDMVRIVEQHGLVPVPIDLNADDVSPQIELMTKALTSRTKAILVAHLFGARFELTPFVVFAQEHDLLVLEDCAQAFDGERYRGHDDAVVSMFSFGPIKTATALGGGLLRIKDEALLKLVRELQSEYPVQSRWFFFKRVLFYSVLKWLGGRIAFGMFIRICRVLGKDLDQVLNGAVRNFPQEEFFEKLRSQPSLPLLLLMARRITKYRHAELDQRTARGLLLVSLLPSEACPGSGSRSHSFWTFPVLVPDPAVAVAALRKAGFDSTARSTLRPIEPPGDRPELEPQVALQNLGSVIYLPVYPAIPESELRRLARVLSR